MTVSENSADELTQELAALRALLADQRSRLDEAEETLRAIREGDVDAVVVSTPCGQRIFALQSADQAYRNIVEQMQEGAVMFVENGHINYSNLRFAELMKKPLEQIIGANFRGFVAAMDADRFTALFAKALTGISRGEFTLRAADGATVPVQASMSLLIIDGLPSICMVVADLTERKQAKQVSELKNINQTLEERVAERTKTIQLLYDIATMANEAQGIEQAVEYCLRRTAIDTGWCFAHALLPAADDPSVLIPGSVYYAVETQRFCAFREATCRLRFRHGEGLAGQVLASGKPEWTIDVRDDLTASKAAAAEAVGIGAAVAVPVPVGNKVAAVLEFFADHPIEPTPRLTHVMLGIGMQMGRVFERAEFEEHLLSIAEEIQQHVAQDLHDDVGQELTGLGLMANTLADMLAPIETRAGKLAVDIAAALERTHDKARGLSRRMLPIELEEGLLSSALEQLATATAVGSSIACDVACDRLGDGLDSHVSLHLYRIAQEAVANAVRHSGAHHIRIRLEQRDGETILSVEDDGAGLSAEAAQTEGMGRRTMRYRAGLIGGELEVGPGRNGGTQVLCRVLAPRPENRFIKSGWRRN